MFTYSIDEELSLKLVTLLDAPRIFELTLDNGEIVEDILGSTWTEKMPKEMVMKKLREDLGVDGKNVLVVGDGRSEIYAGAEMGALVISRLPKTAQYQRKLHNELGANIIVEDYLNNDLYEIFK